MQGTRTISFYWEPCSYCIAIHDLLSNDEKLTEEEIAEYTKHLLKDHHMELFRIEN